MTEQRVRSVVIGSHILLDFLNWYRQPPGSHLAFPVESGIPDDCFNRRSFLALVEHSSFEVVPIGDMPPEHVGFWPMVKTIEKPTVRKAVDEALQRLGVVHAASSDDARRWSRGDLATDLASELTSVK